MKHRVYLLSVVPRLRFPGLLALVILSGVSPGIGQTVIDLRTQTKNVDFSGALSTRPLKTGTALPGACNVGELFFMSAAPAGANVYTCSSANQWSPVAAGPNYSQNFSNQLSVSLAHNLNTTAVTVQCFDSGATPALLESNRIAVTDANHVTVSFVAAQSGTCVVNGSGGASGAGSGGSGGGSVTNTSGNLNLDLPVFGNNGSDIKTGTKTGSGNQAVMSTSPVISAPYIADLTNMQHDHRTPAGGGTLGVSAIAASALSGNGSKLGTVNGNPTGGDCAQFDANGNLADAGFACGTGGGSGQGQSVSAGPGLLLVSGVMQANPAAVRTYLKGSGSLSFGTIGASGGCVSQNISVTGAVIGDKVVLGTPTELLTYSLAMTYAVSASNIVTIRLCNYTTTSVAPPSLTFNVDVVKSF